MTYKEKKSKIADILMDFQEEYSNDVINRPMLASLYAGNILSFIDSMQKEPVNEDLEEAVNAYIGYAPEVDESSSTYGKRQAFKAGAEWQKERMINKACEWLKEHATFMHPRKQRPVCMVNLNVFREAMEE